MGFHYFGTGVALNALGHMGANVVLDLGCGGGWFLIDACRQNPTLRGNTIVALRAVIANILTTEPDIDAVLDDQRRIAEQLSSEGT